MKQVARLQEIIKNKIPEGLVVPKHTDTEHRYMYTKTGETFPSVTGITGIMSSGHLKQWAVNEGLRHLEAHWHNITLENRSEYFRSAQLAHLDTLKEAGDIGTKAHKVVENYLDAWMLTGEKPKDITTFIQDQDSRLYAATRSAELFFNDFYAIPIVSEIKLVHPRYKFGGTMDALMYVGTVIEEGKAGRTGFEKCEHVWKEKLSRGRGLQMECAQCERLLKMTLAVVDFKTSNSVSNHDDYAEQVSAYWYMFYALTGIRAEDLIIVRLDKTKAKYEAVRVADRKRAFDAFLHTKEKYNWTRDNTDKLLPVVTKETIYI